MPIPEGKPLDADSAVYLYVVMHLPRMAVVYVSLHRSAAREWLRMQADSSPLRILRARTFLYNSTTGSTE